MSDLYFFTTENIFERAVVCQHLKEKLLVSTRGKKSI